MLTDGIASIMNVSIENYKCQLIVQFIELSERNRKNFSDFKLFIKFDLF